MYMPEEAMEGGAFGPPKLEDAGLEDCALPPESIMEAFAIAASSRLHTPDDDDKEDKEKEDRRSTCNEYTAPSHFEEDRSVVDRTEGATIGGAGGKTDAGKEDTGLAPDGIPQEVPGGKLEKP